MTDLERRLALLRSRSLMVPTTDPITSKRPAEEPSSKPSLKKTKHATETTPKPRLYAHPIVQREFHRMKAELQKRDQELAAEKSKSLEKNNEYRTQIKLLCAQCSNLTDCNTALAASNTTLQTAHRDLTSELRAHKGALDIAREELTESRKEANTFYKATLKQDEEYKLLKEQLKEAKADEVVQWRMLTNRLRLLGKSHEMGRVVYELLLLQVEGQYGGDRVVLERVKRALEEAFGEFFARE